MLLQRTLQQEFGASRRQPASLGLSRFKWQTYGRGHQAGQSLKIIFIFDCRLFSSIKNLAAGQLLDSVADSRRLVRRRQYASDFSVIFAPLRALFSAIAHLLLRYRAASSASIFDGSLDLIAGAMGWRTVAEGRDSGITALECF